MLPDRSDGDPQLVASPPAFAELMALKQLDSPSHLHGIPSDEPEKIERFQSLASPYPPGEGKMAFGGHVYAQSAYAASKTVEKGFVIHVGPPSYSFNLSKKKTALTLIRI